MSVVEKGNISATQFHPEKSGGAGLDVLKSFLEAGAPSDAAYQSPDSNGEILSTPLGCAINICTMNAMELWAIGLYPGGY